jgi:TupA-like ATPgrasp
VKRAFRAMPLSDAMRRRVLYTARHGRNPNFRNPQTFSEKVNWRILNDRRDILAFTCDKLRVKEAAAELGVDTPRTLWAGVDIRLAADVALPATWVLKPNHGSGLVHIGHGPITPDNRTELVPLTRDWLQDTLGERLGEWAYTQARPMLLIEELAGNGQSPVIDFRFYTFGDIVKYIQADDSHISHSRRFYTPEWKPLEVRQRSALAEPIDRPPGLEQMTAWAKMLGQRFEFMRIDFYDIEGKVLLGELTPYPCGGLVPFVPAAFDAELGELWALPRLC